ncbi:MAG: UDP-N-acetylglucosamine 4,6-dehydratase (inverting) [Nitrospirales bacterium]
MFKQFSLNGKSILITGGTGSFGKKCVEIILQRFHPKKLIILSRDEDKQYQMAKTLDMKKNPCLRFFLGDVRDLGRLHRAFEGVDYVIHAAALKHVPTAEYNPIEAIKTNVLGAENVLNAAIDNGVQKVVALSTDKAACPINLYGASKLCSDKLFIAGNVYSGVKNTRFSIVRYGNVLGSRGSVVPHFLSLRSSGVIPITDRRMTRFWMTLEQGVNIVLSSLGLMKGGEIFIPKIPSMKIVDLARTVAPDCQQEYVGIRPGEKLHELLISEDDGPRTREFNEYYVIEPEFQWWTDNKSERNGGRPVPDGFSYASNTNDQWITSEELCKLIPELQESQPVAC